MFSPKHRLNALSFIMWFFIAVFRPATANICKTYNVSPTIKGLKVNLPNSRLKITATGKVHTNEGGSVKDCDHWTGPNGIPKCHYKDHYGHPFMGLFMDNKSSCNQATTCGSFIGSGPKYVVGGKDVWFRVADVAWGFNDNSGHFSVKVCQESAPTEAPTRMTITDEALVDAVDDTLGECSDIVKAVGDFLHLLEEDDNRRRNEKAGSNAMGVRKKLKTCGAIIDAVDTFRETNFFPWKAGHIELRWSEVGFINQELKQVSKKIGETLFVASKDGQGSSNFHAACDGKGPTVVIVLTTTGNIFGGYAASSWTSSGSYVSASSSFLFRLRPSMRHYTMKKGRESYAMYRHSSYGPTFGGGHDIYIVNNALSSTTSYTNGGHSYDFPGYPNHQLNDGVKNFKVMDYVVMKAIAI